jgi:hypothetical protein
VLDVNTTRPISIAASLKPADEGPVEKATTKVTTLRQPAHYDDVQMYVYTVAFFLSERCVVVVSLLFCFEQISMSASLRPLLTVVIIRSVWTMKAATNAIAIPATKTTLKLTFATVRKL